MSMGCYLPRVPILTTGWSASATIRREMRELTGEPVRLAGFGSTAKKEDARHRIPRVKSGEVERLNTVVVDMVLYEQHRVGWSEGSYLIQDLNQNLFFPEIRHARSVKVLSNKRSMIFIGWFSHDEYDFATWRTPAVINNYRNVI